VAYHWSIHQLTEYFDAVISKEDEDGAVRVAVERAAEALGAELGALLRDDDVLTCVGVGHAAPPVGALIQARAGSVMIDVARLGLLHSSAARIDDDLSGHLVVGRIEDEFTGEERQLLQGMASVLGLALRSLRTLQTERTLRTEREREASERLRLLDTLSQRQRLLESLLTIQKAISRRAPLQTLLDAVTSGAAKLLNDAFVALVLTEPVDGHHRIVSSASPANDAHDHGMLVIEAAAESAALDGVVTLVSDAGGCTVLAAPVHIEGITTGSLVTVVLANVADIGDRREMLAAFAEQASLALTDARTVEAMRDAYHDSLTGLPNRALFLDSLNRALQRAARLGTEVTVLFIDLDRFKDINDSLGHAAGDELLACVAGRIRESLRGEDSAARLGGDEFAILLERTSGYDAGRLVAGRITKALLEPIVLAGREVFAFASIGIASSDESARTADDLLRNADIAMYSAKRSGTRRALLYEPSMHTETMEGLELRGDLSHAVPRGELRLEYQPLVNLATGAAVAVEALVRWDHPRFGVVPPSVFIPMAELNGVIVEVGEWVLRRSCEQAAAWRATSLPDLKISVNVSARQLDEPTFPDLVARVLRATALPASALTLEVTESVLMPDADRTLEQLTRLKALGVRMAIDDFGTGYSSLAWLQHFPADQLKIDKSFIDTIETSTQGSAIVRAVIELARTLGLETVAEGIETMPQWTSLRELSCDLGQGYHFARPLAASAVEPFFAASASTSVEAVDGTGPVARPLPPTPQSPNTTRLSQGKHSRSQRTAPHR
jgi:diguanylate cyclase (GGDEF)-like protein